MPDRPLVVGQSASAVGRDAGAIAPTPTGAIMGHDDLDARIGDVGHSPQRRRAAMAESRLLAAGQHGGHPSAVLSQAVVARGVDAEVEPMQAPVS